MKILHLECGNHWGGQEFRTILEVQWLHEHGHQVWIACDAASRIAEEAAKRGLPCVVIPMNKSSFVTSLFRIWKFVRAQGIEVINSHGSKDAALAYPLHLLGYPVVRYRHIMVQKQANWRSLFLFRHGCRRILACSQNIAQDFVKYVGITPEKISTVGEGVDLKLFHPDVPKNVREEFAVLPDQIFVGMVAMIRSEKGHRKFLRAALKIVDQCPNARFLLVGQGVGARGEELEANLHSIMMKRFGGTCSTRENPLPISLAGYRSDLPQLFSALDVVVIPSNAEGQSQVAPQAFATRRAVIASNVGGLPELITHGQNGHLVPPESVDALAEAMTLLIQDETYRRKLANAGYHYAQQHLSFDRIMGQMLDVYAQMGSPRGSLP